MYKRFEQVAAEAEDRDYLEAKVEQLQKENQKQKMQQLDVIAYGIAGIAQSYVAAYDEMNPIEIWRTYRDMFEKQLDKFRKLQGEING